MLAGCDGTERIAGPATLVGVVRSISTGDPISGAALSADGVEATSDAEGKFALPGLPVGPITVFVTREGYVSATHPVTLGGGTDTTQIQLVPVSASGEAIDSLAFNYPTPSVRITAPGSVRIEVNAYYPYQVSGLFSDTSSIRVRTTGPFTATWVLEHLHRRSVTVTASGPGSGTVTISYGDKSASIDVIAEAVRFKSISVSTGYACGLALDDTAWCWGGNFDGALGFATVSACNGAACQYGGNDGNPTPLPVTGDRKYASIVTAGITCTGFFVVGTCGRTCGLTAAGEAWCWGGGSVEPTRMAPELTFASLTVGAPTNGPRAPAPTCGLTTDGKAWCFTASGSTPVAPTMTFTAFAAGAEHSCGISSGDVYCWGGNQHANLGIGSADTVLHPDPLKVSTSAKATAIGVGRSSTCALETTGVVECWGVAGAAYVALCSPDDPSCVMSPQPAAGGGTYAAIAKASGGPLMCALTASGQADCWSDFTMAAQSVALPEPATSLSVSTGEYYTPDHSCALTASNVLYCWGSPAVVTRFP